eukprot:m.207020 g.207020  ORF g.207020 m.207020 type:complete len:378 (+) comp16912_c2_seq3:262-1395(+)
MSDPKPPAASKNSGQDEKNEVREGEERGEEAAIEDDGTTSKNPPKEDARTGLQRLIAKQQELASVVEEEIKQLEQERAEFEAEKAAWAVLSNKLDATVIPKSRIKLDVGGTIFATSKATLTQDKSNFFAGMFSGRHEIAPEEDGSFFVDRDPFVFRHVLNYLRGQAPKFEYLDTKDMAALQEDAEFYQVTGLLEEMTRFQEDVKKKRKEEEERAKLPFTPGNNYTLSENNFLATKTGANGYNAVVLSHEIPKTGIVRIRFTKVSGDYNVMYGLAPSTINRSAVNVYTQCGWYLHGSGGQLYSGPPTSRSGQAFASVNVSNGQYVDMEVNRGSNTISFNINGTNYGAPYSGVFTASDSLCPCVVLRTAGTSVRIQRLL